MSRTAAMGLVTTLVLAFACSTTAPSVSPGLYELSRFNGAPLPGSLSATGSSPGYPGTGISLLAEVLTLEADHSAEIASSVRITTTSGVSDEQWVSRGHWAAWAGGRIITVSVLGGAGPFLYETDLEVVSDGGVLRTVAERQEIGLSILRIREYTRRQVIQP